MSTLTFTNEARTIDRPKGENPFTDVIAELEVDSDVGASFPVKNATVGALRAYHRQMVEAAANRPDDEDDEKITPVTLRWGVFNARDERVPLYVKTGETDEDGNETTKPRDSDEALGDVVVFFKITKKIKRRPKIAVANDQG